MHIYYEAGNVQFGILTFRPAVLSVEELVILLLCRGFSDGCRGRQKQNQKRRPT